MKILLLLIIILFLSACQSVLIRSENSYIEISPRASIEITQSIEVAPNSARAFFQNGQLITHGQLNLYDVNCEIQINTVSEQSQIAESGVFNIISIAQEESPIVRALSMQRKVLVASIDSALSSSLYYAWAVGSPVDIKRYYYFKLFAQDSSSETKVRALICRGAQDTPSAAMLPSYEEMRAAGGEYIKFNF